MGRSTILTEKRRLLSAVPIRWTSITGWQTGLPWFSTEQPDAVIKKRVEEKLAHLEWRVDYVFSHTVPLHAVPRHTFLSNIDQSTVDYSTEEWLQEIEQKLDYECWFAGHYHVTENIGQINILYEDYEELDTEK